MPTQGPYPNRYFNESLDTVRQPHGMLISIQTALESLEYAKVGTVQLPWLQVT